MPWLGTGAFVLATLGGAPLQARQTPAAEAQPSAGDSQTFIVEGDEAFDKGEYREAIIKYQAAYRSLTQEERMSYLGSIPVRNSMNAYRALAERDDDVGILEDQHGVLVEFLAAVEREGAADAIGSDAIDELVQLRADLEQQIASRETPEPEPTPGATTLEPNPQPRSAPVTMTDEPVGRDWVGLGLVIGGGMLVGTGAGLSVGGWTIPSQAERYADQRATDAPGETAPYADGTEARAAYLADEQARARNFLIAGSVIGGVGVVAAVAGGVKLILHERRARAGVNTALLPSLEQGGGGLSVIGWF